jgi:hypothetical protein
MRSTGEIPYRATDEAPVSFHEALVIQLRRAPWFLLSTAAHAALVLLGLLFGGGGDAPPKAPPNLLLAKLANDVVEPPPAIEPEPTPQPVELDPDRVAPEVDVPVHAPDERDESPTDVDHESTAGEGDAAGPDFSGVSQNSSIGIGSGSGGGRPGLGGRLARRRGVPGGAPPITAADAGLEWLKRHQSPDGSWDCDGFPQYGDPKRGPLCDGIGAPQNDVGVSGLALLAFLGAGQTHRDGVHKEAVRKGLKWLAQQQDAEGCFGPRTGHYTYGHGIAALAMAEAWGMTRSGIWKTPAQKGIDFILAAQNPYKAWRYDVRPGDNDVSVTGWMAMALKSAKLAGGLLVPDEPLKAAHAFVKEMTDEESGRTGYTKKGERPVRPDGKEAAFPAEESEALTAVGMLVRVFNGEDPKQSPMLKAGAELLTKRLPVWEANSGKIDHYYWYYGTLAMFQMGGAEWNQWNAKMLDAVIRTQRTDGNFRGSWDPVDAWGADGGRVYATAVLTMCLEVYYRYDRVFGAR